MKRFGLLCGKAAFFTGSGTCRPPGAQDAPLQPCRVLFQRRKRQRASGIPDQEVRRKGVERHVVFPEKFSGSRHTFCRAGRKLLQKGQHFAPKRIAQIAVITVGRILPLGLVSSFQVCPEFSPGLRQQRAQDVNTIQPTVSCHPGKTGHTGAA